MMYKSNTYYTPWKPKEYANTSDFVSDKRICKNNQLCSTLGIYDYRESQAQGSRIDISESNNIPPVSVDDLFNVGLMKQLIWYNTERPHWSLNFLSPVDYLIKNGHLSKMIWTDTRF